MTINSAQRFKFVTVSSKKEIKLPFILLIMLASSSAECTILSSGESTRTIHWHCCKVSRALGRPDGSSRFVQMENQGSCWQMKRGAIGRGLVEPVRWSHYSKQAGNVDMSSHTWQPQAQPTWMIDVPSTRLQHLWTCKWGTARQLHDVGALQPSRLHRVASFKLSRVCQQWGPLLQPCPDQL